MEGDKEVFLPELTVSLDDPGDEVQKRFRYQVSYAGILSLMLVEEQHGLAEVFCELHEDILVKHDDGKYSGIQVKTKDINLPPFTIDDEAIKKSCVKFVLLEIQFPELFKSFSIVSNIGFDKSKPAVCINSLITKAKNEEEFSKGSKMNLFVKYLSSSCNCAVETVMRAIEKIRVKSFCALEDIHFKLVNQIKMCPIVKGAQESKIEELADLILAKHYKASSLHQDKDLIHSYILGLTDKNEEVVKIIEAKKFTRHQMQGWLNSQKELPVSLLLKDRKRIAEIPLDHRNLEIKMDAGGLDSDNVELMRDLKFSFQQHAISWLYKLGNEKADAQYNQIMLITQNVSKEAYDENKIAETNNGLSMLINVRNKLQQRRGFEPNLFFDCTHEHLLGSVAVLTENCKVWWSKKFDLSK